MTAVAAAAALLSAAAYGCGAALQHNSAAAEPGRRGLGLLALLLRRRRWLAGGACVLTGAGLHLLALRWGPLALVQPIGAAAVVLALPVGALLSARRVSRGEVFAASAVVVGLGCLLLSLRAVAGTAQLAAADLPLVAGTVVIAVTCCAAGGWLLNHRARAVLLATGAGACFGATSALARAVIVQAGEQGVGGALLSLPAAAVVASACAGLVLTQTAYAVGSLGPVLATLTVVDPLVAVGLGHVFLGERVLLSSTGAGLALTGAAAVVLGTGVLARRAPPPRALAHPSRLSRPERPRPCAY